VGEPSDFNVATNAGLGHGPLPSAFSIKGYSIDRPNGERLTTVPVAAVAAVAAVATAAFVAIAALAAALACVAEAPRVAAAAV
jgi:hypothetical protein